MEINWYGILTYVIIIIVVVSISHYFAFVLPNKGKKTEGNDMSERNKNRASEFISTQAQQHLMNGSLVDDVRALVRLLDKVEQEAKGPYTKNGLVPDDVFMSKREQMAVILAQGMLARGDMDYTQIPEDAVDMTDELIAEVNKNAV